jgi:hypothetical protein
MWPVMDSHSLVEVYGFVIITPTISLILISRLIHWWN